jgi:hypothetical protein
LPPPSVISSSAHKAVPGVGAEGKSRQSPIRIEPA